MLEGDAKDLTNREQAFHLLVDASHNVQADTRRLLVQRAAQTLAVDEVYLANTVIALFNFYNKWADLNGVELLTPEGYAMSGKRLAQHGYATIK